MRANPDLVDWQSVSWKIYLLCVALSFFVLIEPAPTDLVFCIALMAFALSKVEKVRLFGPILTLSIIVFLWFSLLSVLWVDALVVRAARAIAIEFYLIALFAMTAYFARIWGDYAFRMILCMLMIGGAIASLIGILAFLDLVPSREIFFRDESLKRIQATFKDPNVFGPYLISSILATVWILLTVQKRRVLALALMGLFLTALVITFSRGAWVHFVVTFACFFPALLFYRRTAQSALIYFAVFGGLSILTAVYFSGDILRVLDDSYFAQRLSFQSYDSKRFDLIWLAMSDMLKNPLGIGPYQARLKYGWEPHNSFVLLGLHNGILALIAYLVIFFAAVFHCVRRIASGEEGWFKYAFLLSILVGLFVLSNVVSSLHWRHLYVILGLAFGEYRSNLFFERGTERNLQWRQVDLQRFRRQS